MQMWQTICFCSFFYSNRSSFLTMLLCLNNRATKTMLPWQPLKDGGMKARGLKDGKKLGRQKKARRNSSNVTVVPLLCTRGTVVTHVLPGASLQERQSVIHINHHYQIFYRVKEEPLSVKILVNKLVYQFKAQHWLTWIPHIKWKAELI